jgi:hypothetical protein
MGLTATATICGHTPPHAGMVILLGKSEQEPKIRGSANPYPTLDGGQCVWTA